MIVTGMSAPSIDDKVSCLDIAATNVYNEFCRKNQPVSVKQKRMTEELVDELCEVHAKWRLVKVLGEDSSHGNKH